MHQSPSKSPTHRRYNGMDYVVHHHKYYIPGGDLYFLVDGIMFKVHSYFFKRESKIFLDNTTPPDPSTSEETKEDEGRSEDRAIRLLDVSVQDFEKFLWVFYNPKYDIYDANIDWWFSILKLAHKWDFPIVKEFALRELRRRESEIPLVTRIILYQEYEAPPEYLVPLFSELCAREYGLTDGETLALGFELACRVWKTREALRNPGGASPLPSGLTDTDCFSVVSEVMDLPPYPTSTVSTAIPETKTEVEDTLPDASEEAAPAPNVKDTDKKKQKQKQKQKELLSSTSPFSIPPFALRPGSSLMPSPTLSLRSPPSKPRTQSPGRYPSTRSCNHQRVAVSASSSEQEPQLGRPHGADRKRVSWDMDREGSHSVSTAHRTPHHGNQDDQRTSSLRQAYAGSKAHLQEYTDTASYPPEPRPVSRSLGRPLTRSSRVARRTSEDITKDHPISELRHTPIAPIPRVKPPLRAVTRAPRPQSEHIHPAPKRLHAVAPRPQSEFKSKDDESRDMLSRMAAHTRSLSAETRYQAVQPRIRAPALDDGWKRGSREAIATMQHQVVDTQPRPQPLPSFDVSKNTYGTEGIASNRLKKRRDVLEDRFEEPGENENSGKWSPLHYLKGITPPVSKSSLSLSLSLTLPLSAAVCLGLTQEVPALNSRLNPMHIVQLNRPQEEEDQERWTRVHLGFDMTPVQSRRESDAYTIASRREDRRRPEVGISLWPSPLVQPVSLDLERQENFIATLGGAPSPSSNDSTFNPGINSEFAQNTSTIEPLPNRSQLRSAGLISIRSGTGIVSPYHLIIAPCRHPSLDPSQLFTSPAKLDALRCLRSDSSWSHAFLPPSSFVRDDERFAPFCLTHSSLLIAIVVNAIQLSSLRRRPTPRLTLPIPLSLPASHHRQNLKFRHRRRHPLNVQIVALDLPVLIPPPPSSSPMDPPQDYFTVHSPRPSRPMPTASGRETREGFMSTSHRIVTVEVNLEERSPLRLTIVRCSPAIALSAARDGVSKHIWLGDSDSRKPPIVGIAVPPVHDFIDNRICRQLPIPPNPSIGRITTSIHHFNSSTTQPKPGRPSERKTAVFTLEFVYPECVPLESTLTALRNAFPMQVLHVLKDSTVLTSHLFALPFPDCILRHQLTQRTPYGRDLDEIEYQAPRNYSHFAYSPGHLVDSLEPHRDNPACRSPRSIALSKRR
ncbi:hypothetical protein NMY22_g14781 [Coprinellus aureogranulatus]|nr:hypothetical protein NMY22_g14781 [Coprinellus aureogranulatus]